MSLWTNKLDADELSFFSEDAVKKWLVQKKVQNMQIGKQLLFMLAIVMGSGTVLATLVSGIFGWKGMGIACFMLVEACFACIFIALTYGSLAKFFSEITLQLKGSWVMEIKCRCARTTFEKLSKKDAMDIKNNGNKILDVTGKESSCRACKGKMKVKRLWIMHVDKETWKAERKRLRTERNRSRGAIGNARGSLYKHAVKGGSNVNG